MENAKATADKKAKQQRMRFFSSFCAMTGNENRPGFIMGIILSLLLFLSDKRGIIYCKIFYKYVITFTYKSCWIEIFI